MARTSTSPDPHVPLGSLTQPGARAGASCRACGSDRVTAIAMTLTDGSPVDFASCHRCEHRTWRAGQRRRRSPSPRVLDKTRKVADPHQPAPRAARSRAGRLAAGLAPVRRDLSTIVKAYDVRGVVPDQLDADVAARPRRRVRRASSARPAAHRRRPRHARVRRRAGRGVRRGRDRARASTSSTSGSARPTCSTTPAARSTCPARCSPPATTRRSTTASSCAAPAPRRSARTPGCAEIRERRRALPRRRPAGADGPAGTVDRAATCSPATPRTCATLVDLSRHPPAEGRRRRRQRHGRPHRAGRASPGCRSTSIAAVLRARRHASPTTRPTRSTRRTCVDLQAAVREHGADLGLAFDGDADRCFVVDERGEPVSPSARHRAGRRRASWPSTPARRSSTT